MAQYSNFFDAYMAKNAPKPTPAQTTWTPQNLQNLANAYSTVNPTWTPPAEQNAALPHPIQPVTFNPWSDPSYLFGAAGIEQQKTLAQGAYNYGTDTRGPQEFGYTYDPATGNVAQQASTAYGYNPYNQAAELQRSYDNAKRGTTNSYAASGQLYSGALKNAQATNSYNFDKSSNSIQRNAADYYHGLQSNLDAQSNQYTDLILKSLSDFIKTQGG